MQLNGVSVKKGNRTILQDVTYTIPHNKIVVLTGPSGAGKTTLLRVLAQLEKPTSGTVLSDRRSIGMVFQHFHLFPHMTILQQIAHPLIIVHKIEPKEAYARAEEVLSAVGLLTYQDRYAHELSGGQQQRAALARALACKPEILLLDEPTSGLDRATKDNLAVLLKQLKTSHSITIVMSTHDIEFARELHDVWCVIEHGTPSFLENR